MRRRSLLILLLVAWMTGCATVGVHEKERLADPIMIFDADASYTAMQGHMLLPREAALGGFSSVGAGGCSCK